MVTTHPHGTKFAATTGVVTAFRVPEIRGIVLRSVLPVLEQGDNTEDSVPCEQLLIMKTCKGDIVPE